MKPVVARARPQTLMSSLSSPALSRAQSAGSSCNWDAQSERTGSPFSSCVARTAGMPLLVFGSPSISPRLAASPLSPLGSKPPPVGMGDAVSDKHRDYLLELAAERARLASQHRALQQRVADAKREARLRQQEQGLPPCTRPSSSGSSPSQLSSAGSKTRPSSRLQQVGATLAPLAPPNYRSEEQSSSHSSSRPIRRPSSSTVTSAAAAAASSRGPLFIWPAELSHGDSAALCEQEKVQLKSLVQRREHLKNEQRVLSEEVHLAQREARSVLALQRAEYAAIKAEQEELRLLAEEAQKLVELKKMVSEANLSVAGSADGTVPELAGVEELLSREHARVVRRAKSATALMSPASPSRLAAGETLELESPSRTPEQLTPRIHRAVSVSFP